MSESGFSPLVNVNTKARNKLDCETDMSCVLSSTKSTIKLLVSKKQLHPHINVCENKIVFYLFLLIYA